MSADQNKEIVKKYWLTFCTPNAQEAFDLMADDATWHVMGTGGVAQTGPVSKEVFKSMMLLSGGSQHPDRKADSMFPGGLTLSLKSIIAEGDHVVLEGESHSTVANGNNYNNLYSIHFELKNGKIQTVREYMDTKHQFDAASDVMHLAAD
ncbi:hypothetical protein [Rhodococcus sp. (in: high G+C Gram-positive bacteria)]|uniref:nuclear transport factor 2 family protein n=1 Tax=Rhodococcus sp. TaxID=1831 RepID=UPI00257C49E1|nr:hypothetical protein [Rhodococcus sp. (in: high G+C Gram-positive bacteria)]MBQ9052613.1 nuclear transport factor 2 family protein [Rhodococcus sp. (in: high G+C Gram-positive bacteria)]